MSTTSSVVSETSNRDVGALKPSLDYVDSIPLDEVMIFTPLPSHPLSTGFVDVYT